MLRAIRPKGYPRAAWPQAFTAEGSVWKQANLPLSERSAKSKGALPRGGCAYFILGGISYEA